MQTKINDLTQVANLVDDGSLSPIEIHNLLTK